MNFFDAYQTKSTYPELSTSLGQDQFIMIIFRQPPYWNKVKANTEKNISYDNNHCTKCGKSDTHTNMWPKPKLSVKMLTQNAPIHRYRSFGDRCVRQAPTCGATVRTQAVWWLTDSRLNETTIHSVLAEGFALRLGRLWQTAEALSLCYGRRTWVHNHVVRSLQRW